MNEIAVFTPEVAAALIERGFVLTGRTNKAWLFEDSVLLERAVCELVEALAHK